MTPGIFVISEQGDLLEMVMQPYEAEDVLQKLLADYPGVLAGEGKASGRRFALIRREAGVPSHEGGPNRWSLDHLFVDDQGIPTFVEVKRGTDTRIRREVVGQMLDYAANGLSYWEADALRHHFEELHPDPQDILRELLGEEEDVDDFWERVRTNLSAKKVRLVFVADDIPQELRSLIEFLNEQLRTIEVLGLEVKQYGGGTLRTLVATTVGQTQAAQQVKSERDPSPRELQYKGFWEQFLPQLHETYPGWSRARKPSLVSWLELPSGKSNVVYGVNFTGPGRLRAEVYLYKGSETYPSLLRKKNQIEAALGEPLTWDPLPDRVGSRIAVYRQGDVADVENWSDYSVWFLRKLGALRDAFQVHVDAL